MNQAPYSLVILVVIFASGGCAPPSFSREDTDAVSSSIERGFTVGMPFDGMFDSFALATPANHHIIYGADWATDIYAIPGTSVRFHSTARGKVRRISGTCAKGGPETGGSTVSIDLLDAAGKVIGRAHFAHLAGVQVKAGEELEEGRLLGTTRLWPRTSCYDVTNAQGVHVHFEAESIAASSCWIPASKSKLSEGSAVARVDADDKRGQCSGASTNPPPPPSSPPPSQTPRPTGGPFQALHIKSPIKANAFITQCSEDASGERVWTTTNSGPEPSSRWASASYPQLVSADCGRAAEQIYPLVFRSHLPGEVSGWVGECVEDGKGTELVFRIDSKTTVDGHPIAAFAYPQTSAECP